jgi:hypothetical protein
MLLPFFFPFEHMVSDNILLSQHPLANGNISIRHIYPLQIGQAHMFLLSGTRFRWMNRMRSNWSTIKIPLFSNTVLQFSWKSLLISKKSKSYSAFFSVSNGCCHTELIFAYQYQNCSSNNRRCNSDRSLQCSIDSVFSVEIGCFILGTSRLIVYLAQFG